MDGLLEWIWRDTVIVNDRLINEHDRLTNEH